MKTFYLMLLVLILMLMQSIAADRISFGEIAPDFLLLVVLFYSLHRGAVKGAFFGFILGLAQDLGNPTFLGLNALLKSITGYLMGRAGQKMFPENVILLFALIASFVFGHDIVYLIFFKWPDLGSAFVVVFGVALPSAAYTGVVGVAANQIIRLLGARVVRSRGKEGQ